MKQTDFDKLVKDTKEQEAELKLKRESIEQVLIEEEVEEWSQIEVPMPIQKELKDLGYQNVSNNINLVKRLRFWSNKQQNKRLEDRIEKTIGSKLQENEKTIKKLQEINTQLVEEKSRLYDELEEVRNLRAQNAEYKALFEEIDKNKTRAEYFMESLASLLSNIGR